MLKKSDHFLLNDMYVNAFNGYKKLLEEEPNKPLLHYRLALVYAVIYPEKYHRDRELFFALNTLTQKNIFTQHFTESFLKQSLMITSDIEKKMPPIQLRNLSLHPHCQLLIFPSSTHSYSIFLISEEIEHLRIQFVTSLFCDHIDEIKITEKAFPLQNKNLFIIQSSNKEYRSFTFFYISPDNNIHLLLNKQGLLHGEFNFQDLNTPLLAIEESLQPSWEHTYFENFFLTQVSLFQYSDKNDNYILSKQFIQDSPISCIFSFIRALSINENIDKAYSLVVPELLLNNFINSSIIDFKKQFSNPPFSIFRKSYQNKNQFNTIKHISFQHSLTTKNKQKIKVSIGYNDSLFLFFLSKNRNWKIVNIVELEKKGTSVEKEIGFML